MARVTTSKAARHFGVSGQTIRRWIASGQMKGVRDNHGNILVEIDATSVAASPTSEAPLVATTVPEPTIPLSQALGMLVEQQARHDAETARREAETERRHMDALGRMTAQAASERALLIERCDALECRAENAEARADRVEQRLDQILQMMLDERRRAWWRWWPRGPAAWW